MGSVNLTVLHRKVAQLYSGQLDEWVCASVGSIYSTGGSYTYKGCSKPVFGATASQSWLCRKKVSALDTFPEECLNHGYRHDGKCCSFEEGITCYRFSVRLVDQSGELEALIWAPAIHLLSVRAEEFESMTIKEQEDVFQGLQGREWRFNILSVVDEIGFRQFKVQFLLPCERTYVLNKTPKPSTETMSDLPRMASLTLPTISRSLENGGNLGSSKYGGPVYGPSASQKKVSILESEDTSPTSSLGKESPLRASSLKHLQTSLESLVNASQQNTKAVEQLALALTELQKDFA